MVLILVTTCDLGLLAHQSSALGGYFLQSISQTCFQENPSNVCGKLKDSICCVFFFSEYYIIYQIV